MTDPSRGVRVRRVNRRPGWVLLTALLVLAIVASTVLVFTNRVELLKLAVVLALWAAVAAAFVSFIYRRQSDLDQAKVRDLKYVYDLQLDREISARREYELAVEAQLRRELSAELRAQAADEVAALRAELAALRTNLEILFDTDLDHRPALETERPAGRVIASRIDTPVPAEFLPPPRPAREPRTEESPIIDVPAEPHPPEYQWAPPEPVRPEPVAPELFGGAHRRASDAEEPAPWQRRGATSQPPPPPQQPPPPAAPPIPEPAVAQWSPPPAPEPAPHAEQPSPETPERRGRHYGADAESAPPPRRSRHAVPGETGPPPPRTRRAAQPDREPPVPPVQAPTPPPVQAPTPPPAARHRSAEELQRAAEQPEPEGGQHAGGQPVSELLSRLQATPTGGGRRRRREE
ncbi:MAG: DUF6779 domain-containing protein [Mycobacterium sp.]|nr:DUF6779 domain-containing protein [Mycobacterium sp.]